MKKPHCGKDKESHVFRIDFVRTAGDSEVATEEQVGREALVSCKGVPQDQTWVKTE